VISAGLVAKELISTERLIVAIDADLEPGTYAKEIAWLTMELLSCAVVKKLSFRA
jgi:hypothetical protein